jgi:hypothetical protein
MITKYNMATIVLNENDKIKMKKKNKELKSNWYYNCNPIIKYMNNPDILQKLNIGSSILYNYVIIHIIFDLQFDDIVELLNYLYNENREKNSSEMEDFLLRVKTVFENYIMVKDNKKGILLIKNKIQQFKQDKKMEIIEKNIMEQLNEIGIALVMYNDGKWQETDKLREYTMMKSNISLDIVRQKDIKEKLNETIGFIVYFEDENYLVFKTKNMKMKRSKGSRCDQKQSHISTGILFDSILNKVEGLKDFFTERKDNEIFENKKYICILQEMILYIFNQRKVNGKIWFLDPIKSTLSNIENLEE